MLEKSEEGKPVAIGLKLKYWAGIPYQELFGNISPLKNKLEVSQRFYFFDGQIAISIDGGLSVFTKPMVRKTDSG